MKTDPNLSPERRWARGVICMAEADFPPDSEWLAATRSRLEASDDASLRLLHSVLSGRETVVALSESQFDLYFGLQILLASRRAGEGLRQGFDLATTAMSRGAYAITRKAERVLGSALKARRWLAAPHAVLGETPLRLLGSRLGRRVVYDELVRIDWSDLA